MLSSVHCPLCGDSFPPGIFVCPKDQTPYPIDEVGVIVPTRVDIKLPFAPEPEENLLGVGSTKEKKESEHSPLRSQFVVGPGTVIGEYVIEQKIGEGGMGEIWRGVQPLIGKQVAVKILRGKIAAEQESVERFIREAKSVNSIKHRALVDIFSFGDLPDGRPYFVMEFLSGQSLGSYISKNGPLSWAEMLEIFIQLCEALHATHAQNIIHRDLKSENLFLIFEPDKPLLVKVLDFGLAKLIDAEQENAQLTQDGFVFGTPAYMAPEQCKGETSARSDIYSLGIILFECITGRTPFLEPGMKATEVMLRQVGDPAPAPSSMVSGRSVPRSVDELVLQVLSKSPEERPSSGAVFGQMLREVLGPLAKANAPQEPRSAKPIFLPVSQRKKKKTQGANLLFWSGAVVALGLVIVLYQSLTIPDPVAATSTQIQAPEVSKTIPAASLPKEARLTATSTPPGAEVWIDDELVGKTPLIEEDVPYSEAPVKLSIKKEGFQPYELEVVLKGSSTYGVSLEKVGSKKESKLTDDTKNNTEKPKKTKEDLEALIDSPFAPKPKPR